MIKRYICAGWAVAMLATPALAQDPSRTAEVMPSFTRAAASRPAAAAPASAATAVRLAPRPRLHRPAFKAVLWVLPPSRFAALGPEPESVDVAAVALTPKPAQAAPATPPPALRPTAAEQPTAEVTDSREGRRRRGRHRDMVASVGRHPDLDSLIAAHAKANNIPESMVHRIVVRESRYNPRAVGRGGAMGLMQIKHATARAMGYAGTPAGLLDADTNLRYAVPYLAGAYRTAGGNPDRTVGYYASGYYYAAKRQRVARAKPSELQPEDTDGLTQAQRAAAARPSIFSILLGQAQPTDPATLSGRRE